ncbi:hypothetical protein BHM03_00042225 [Ensete ventricosum]|nr:hypothetical protein BHM03_00042225 [Ensete ventricosum]
MSFHVFADVDDEDQPSGITIYANEETKEEYEDGELPERSEPEPPQRKMTVKFPGINAPILENADHHRWASPSTGSGYSPRYSPYNHNPMPRSPDLGRSLSDRGWRSPLHYETSPAHSPRSPYPYPSATQSPNDHQWSHDHWSNKSSYGRIPDSASQKAQDRHDHRGSHHRRYPLHEDAYAGAPAWNMYRGILATVSRTRVAIVVLRALIGRTSAANKSPPNFPNPSLSNTPNPFGRRIYCCFPTTTTATALLLWSSIGLSTDAAVLLFLFHLGEFSSSSPTPLLLRDRSMFNMG